MHAFRRASSVVAVLSGLGLLGGCGLVLGLGDFKDAPAGAGGGTSTSSTGGGTTTSSAGGGGGAACSGGAMACDTKASCGVPPTECIEYDCVSGCCVTKDVSDLTPVTKGQTPHDCQMVLCDGMGATKSAADPTDMPLPMDECHSASCDGLNAVQTPIEGPCMLNGAPAVCGALGTDAAGSCVECNDNGDCAAGDGCVMNKCLKANCTDTVKDGDETDTDCGGSCLPCSLGLACDVPGDCAPNNCKNGVCVQATCSDGVADGTESDVDCGGSCPKKCGAGQSCAAANDCMTGPNGMPTCDGTCGFTCNGGYGDCDANVGCEADLSTPAHCGACNNHCSAYCVGGTCNDPVEVVGGYGQSCAITTDGSVYCWGINVEGEVGDGTTGNNRLQPVKITLPGPAVSLGAGGIYVGSNPVYSASTCAAINDGTLYCWGDNTYGQLGQGNTTPVVGPVKVPGLTLIAKVAVGGGHVCAVTSNKNVYCWGRNSSGEVGQGNTTSPVTSPVLITPGGAQFATVAVDAGAYHTCALRTDKTVYCWGLNLNGQLGTGNQTPSPSPIAVPGLSNVVGVATGRYFSCAWTGSENYCWGRNQGGELGVGMAAGNYVPTPTLVPGVPPATLIATGGYHAMAITASGIYGWGADGNGQLGDGMNTNIQWSTELVFPAGAYSKLNMAETTTCGIAANGSFCWGSGLNGELGTGVAMDSATPVPVKW